MKLEDLKNAKEKPLIWLLVIFIIVLALRLYIAFYTPFFNHDAYFNLRQVENIRETGTPLYKDPLSYGGKTQLFAPLNQYILAAFSLIMPVEMAGKIIPNIIAALIIFIVYYLSFKVTKNNKISLMTSFMSGFIPIYFIDINRISINYLAVLLMFTIVYCMLRLNERKYVDYALILMFMLVLTTPMAFVLVIGLLLYLLFLKLENFAIEMKELEIILFFTFLVFWVNLLIYKNAFLTHGLLVVWQNVPLQILSNFFGNIGFIQVIGVISIVPIVLGVYAFYAVFHLERSKEVLILLSLGLSAFILLWFKLLDLISGLIILSITLVILTAYTIKRIDSFIEKSKIHKYDKIVYISIMILFLLTVIPSILSVISSPKFGPLSTPTVGDVEVLKWASENIQKNAVIMSGLDEGNIVAYYGKRKNVMDTNFLLTPRIDQRLTDINSVYTTTFETNAIGILNKYNSKYLLVTPKTMQGYQIKELSYIKDNKCFSLEYAREGTYLYRTDCKVE
jgi:4-amino-4-deoxy-L-arabinose transferase-like glycosyltransferase